MCVPLCGRFGPDEGDVAGLVLRGTRQSLGDSLWQMAGMNFQTRSRGNPYKFLTCIDLGVTPGCRIFPYEPLIYTHQSPIFDGFALYFRKPPEFPPGDFSIRMICSKRRVNRPAACRPLRWQRE
ncbi:DUF6783 domain-containing protein [Enterocloster lavalensis]|uniref:DUF6783 domain-containing protein n=1 Tax=Enterocloster lavalensis TaxID=460384 RepID=UPI0034A3DE96